jgi:septal ring factor EnvC (AmiA/AmiB activator)
MRLNELKSGRNTLGQTGAGDIEISRIARKARAMYPNLQHDDLEAVLKYLDMGLDNDQHEVEKISRSDAEQEKDIDNLDQEVDQLDREVDDLESKEKTDRDIIADLRNTIKILQAR